LSGPLGDFDIDNLDTPLIPRAVTGCVPLSEPDLIDREVRDDKTAPVVFRPRGVKSLGTCTAELICETFLTPTGQPDSVWADLSMVTSVPAGYDPSVKNCIADLVIR
jgi:hypothetical protein